MSQGRRVVQRRGEPEMEWCETRLGAAVMRDCSSSSDRSSTQRLAPPSSRVALCCSGAWRSMRFEAPADRRPIHDTTALQHHRNSARVADVGQRIGVHDHQVRPLAGSTDPRSFDTPMIRAAELVAARIASAGVRPEATNSSSSRCTAVGSCQTSVPVPTVTPARASFGSVIAGIASGAVETRAIGLVGAGHAREVIVRYEWCDLGVDVEHPGVLVHGHAQRHVDDRRHDRDARRRSSWIWSSYNITSLSAYGSPAPRVEQNARCSLASMPAAISGNCVAQCPVARMPRRWASAIMRALMSHRRNVRVLMCWRRTPAPDRPSRRTWLESASGSMPRPCSSSIPQSL